MLHRIEKIDMNHHPAMLAKVLEDYCSVVANLSLVSAR